ncbi:MAG TPA: ABC transporter permease, partial [Fibrobacteria bacterium]|nr:ABC transporter permease [Fibrobacteria bacterium]
WGEPPGLRELRVVYEGIAQTDSSIREASQKLSKDLGLAGDQVLEIRVPRPHAHPHQAQMTTMLLLMVSFAFLALFLGSILAATTISAMMVRQRRELGILKALGADTNRIFSRYAATVAGMGFLSFLFAWPPSLFGAAAFARTISKLLNIDIANSSVPWTVALAMGVASVVVPLAACWIPLRRAGAVPPRAAMDDHDAARPSLLAPAWLPVPVRDALRRPSRLAMSLALLGAAGAVFLTALNIRDGWNANLAKIWQTRHYDVEVRFLRPVDLEKLEVLEHLPGVVESEPWGFSHAAFAREGEVDVVRTWPDRSHGSLYAMAPPLSTRMVSFPLVAGRRLVSADSDGVVLNHTAWSQAGKPAMGSPILLSLEGTQVRKVLRGVLEEIGSPGTAYLTDSAFARATGSRRAVSMFRLRSSAGSPAERQALVQRLEHELVAQGFPVEMVIPFSELRTAVGDHVLVLVRSLVAIAGVMGLVGILGLAATAGMNVLERTREIGVMKALGAAPATLSRRILRETMTVSVISWVLGAAASLPLTLFLDRLIGMLGFLAPLPMEVSWSAIALWGAMVAGTSLLAAWLPARRAGSLSVREALAGL